MVLELRLSYKIFLSLFGVKYLYNKNQKEDYNGGITVTVDFRLSCEFTVPIRKL